MGNSTETGQASPNVEVVRRYHILSKHYPQRFAPGPGGLDWANQPDPFRRFSGTDLVPLPLVAGEGLCRYDALFDPAAAEPRPFDMEGLGLLFELGLGLSAWKEYGESRWALRNNPSSGNLHPTEGYLVIASDTPGAPEPGVYHYAPHEHALERRCRFSDDIRQTLRQAVPAHCALVGLTSVHWREAWKYGERAFRYCQHDAGHAIAALRFAARVLGWNLRVLTGPSDPDIAALLGLGRSEDFEGAEREHPDCLAVLDPSGGGIGEIPLGADLASAMVTAEWHGRANRLSPHHAPWPTMETAETAAAKPEPSAPPTGPAPATIGDSPEPALATRPPADGVQIIRQRRSAVAMDGKTAITRSAFLRMMTRVMPDPTRPPWDAFPFPPAVFLGLFIHRVEDIEPGLYLLAREPGLLPAFRAHCAADYLVWQPVADCPLPLFALMPGADLRAVAAQISCGQDIAGDGAFSLGMIAEFDRKVPDAKTVWLYREELARAGVIEGLFEDFDGYLEQQGYLAMGGQIIDASIVPVPKQRNSRDENARIKDGETPEGWETQPAKRSQKDTDARWTKKHGESHYGYKNHVNVDRRHKLVRRYQVTDAAVHDSQVVEDILDPDNTASDVWADSAYRSAEIEAKLEEKGLNSRIHRKGHRNKLLTERQKRGNKTRSKVRARVEHVFGAQSNDMGGTLVRGIGLVRAKARIGLKNLAYNMRRLVQLQRLAMAGAR